MDETTNFIAHVLWAMTFCVRKTTFSCNVLWVYAFNFVASNFCITYNLHIFPLLKHSQQFEIMVLVMLYGWVQYFCGYLVSCDLQGLTQIVLSNMECWRQVLKTSHQRSKLKNIIFINDVERSNF